jgi:hypothetical protein
MMAAVGWRMSFSDHESVQWIAPVAENLKHHSYPFIVESVLFGGSGAELEGCVVGGKAGVGVPSFKVLAKTAVDDESVLFGGVARAGRHSGAF